MGSQRTAQLLAQVFIASEAKEIADLLQEVTKSRHLLSHLLDEQAKGLVQYLHRRWPADLEGQIQSCCLLLLARWCRSQDQSIGSVASSHLLLAVMDQAANIAASQASYDVKCSACILLSCSVLASQELAPKAESQLSQTMLHDGHKLPASMYLRELISAITRFCLLKQDAEFTLWWQTLIIQLWEDCSQNAHKGVSECETDQYMAHMPAVLNSFNLIAASFAQQQLQRTVGLPQRASMTSLVELILACQESPARNVQAAGLVSAAGLFAGYCKAAGPRASKDVKKKLSTIISRGCAQSRASDSSFAQQAATFAYLQNALMPNQPQASEDCIQRSFASLFMALLDLKGLLQPGSMTQPPGGLGHNISKRLANPFVELSTSYANQLARLYRTAEPQEQQEVRVMMASAVSSLGSSYAAFAMSHQNPRLQARDQDHLLQVLHKAFAFCVTILAAVWAAAEESTAGQEDRTGVAQGADGKRAAWILDQLALLQFCRTRLPAYADLLRETYAVVAVSKQASQALLEQLPRYSDLVAVVSGGSGGQDGRVRFHADYVLAAEMQFRMQLLGPLIPLLDEKTASLLDTVVPIAYLYLAHPAESVTTAAHALFCAVLSNSQEKEQLVPFYMRRSLENFPGSTPLRSLTTGIDAILRQLPAGSPMKLLSLKGICDRTSGLVADGCAHEDILGLLHLQAYTLLVLDIELLRDGLDMVHCTLKDLPASLNHEAKSGTSRIIANSEDAVRKVWLVRWLQEL